MTGGSPKVNAAMLPEELRQIIPIAETVARSIGRSWATGPLQRAVAVLNLWIEQGSARAVNNSTVRCRIRLLSPALSMNWPARTRARPFIETAGRIGRT
jgi:hypothetical protein